MPYQVVRLSGALLLGCLGLLGMGWGLPGWPYVLGPALIGAAHAGLQLLRGNDRPITSLLIDATLIAFVMMVVGSMPAPEIAAAAYLITASMLLLSPIEAMIALAYGATLGALVVAYAPITPELAELEETSRLTLARVAGAVFLVGLAVLLVAASRVLRMFRRSQEASLERERRANEIKSEFVSMVSHEFRTPLTSIAGFVETLRDSWRDLTPEEIDEFIQIIYGETQHLSNLVEDVLAIPRLEAGRMPLEQQDFDVAETARQVVAVVFPQGGPPDTGVAIPPGVIVRGDQRRVVQVLRNLVENAAKYGGDEILIEGANRGEMYQVDVSDNGPGVPEAARERIFDHFEQGSSGDDRTDNGVGLGLPIAQRLVHAMGGELWYEPRFPIGARFSFTLRLVRTGDAGPGSADRSTVEMQPAPEREELTERV